MGPMREIETFCDFAQLKSDLGELLHRVSYLY